MNNDLKNLQQLLQLAIHRTDKEAQKLKSSRQQYEQLLAKLVSCKRSHQVFLNKKNAIKKQLMEDLMYQSAVRPNAVLEYASKIEKLDHKHRTLTDKVTQATTDADIMNDKIIEQQNIYTAASSKEAKLQALKDELTTAVMIEAAYKEDIESEDTYAGIWSHRNN